ncbi:MAG: hypothetical protein VB087_12655 [Candidatus Limiplasma sp.]|nr:hypothetical protein [Candidatus Limiplasma sp.]
MNNLWRTIAQYAPMAPAVYANNPAYTIRPEWQVWRDGVARIVYRAYYRKYPIYELDKSSSLVAVQDALHDYIMEAHHATPLCD